MPKVMEINGDGHTMYFKDSPSISFSLVSRDGRLVRPMATCRDYINDCVIAFLNQQKEGHDIGMGSWKKGRNAPIDMNSLRLIIQKGPNKRKEITTKLVEERILDAKRIINMYEELANFSRRSKIKRVKLNNVKCWLLVGPSQWMKSTHLISMVTLIFRVVTAHGGFHDCETIAHVEQRFKELCRNNSKTSYYSTDLSRLLPPSWPKFRMYMEMYQKMFGNRTKAFWNPEDGVGHWHSPGGIYSLSSNTMPNKRLSRHIVRMNKLYKKSKSA
jgi:hypothetical protein